MSFDLTTLHTNLAARAQTDALLALNPTLGDYGLALTRPQAAALAASQEEALRTNGRLELGVGPLPALAMAFCDSPYLSQRTLTETLQTLTELFYDFKNETEDRINDAELIAFMKEAYNGVCGGSLELLAGRELPRLADRLRGRLADEEAQSGANQQEDATDEGNGTT